MPCFSSHFIHCSVFKVQLSSTQTPYHSQQRSRYFSLISLCLLFDPQTLALVCESSQNLTILIFLRPDANVQFLERFHLFSKAYRLLLSGGDSRDRTGDLLLARQALSQLSYIPIVESSSVSLAAALALRLACSAASPLLAQTLRWFALGT